MNQINLNSPFRKEALKYLGWILLFVFLWFRGCTNSETPNVITKFTVPEVKGKFDFKIPYHEPIEMAKESPEKVTIIQEKNSASTVFAYNQMAKENEKLKADFAKANDSIKKLSFHKAVELNKFSTNFEDENLILNINGIVQGEVKEITPNYTIKEKTINAPVKQKETVFRVLAGGAIGSNKELNQTAYQLDLNFQNRKGNIISVEYLNLAGQGYGMVGYKFSILNIKR